MLDLVDMGRSHCYNPLAYVRDDADAQRLNTNRFKATTPKGSQSQDPFWDTAAGMLHPVSYTHLDVYKRQMQKRARPGACDPEWVHTERTETGVEVSSYFVSHPEMVLGLSLIHISSQPKTANASCSSASRRGSATIPPLLRLSR